MWVLQINTLIYKAVLLFSFLVVHVGLANAPVYLLYGAALLIPFNSCISYHCNIRQRIMHIPSGLDSSDCSRSCDCRKTTNLLTADLKHKLGSVDTNDLDQDEELQ